MILRDIFTAVVKYLDPRYLFRQLRLIPYDYRAQIYAALGKLSPIAVSAGVITDGTLSFILLLVGAVLGVSGTALAAANTPRVKGWVDGRRVLAIGPALLPFVILPMQCVPADQVPNPITAECRVWGDTIAVSECNRLEQNNWRQRVRAWCGSIDQGGSGWVLGSWTNRNGVDSVVACASWTGRLPTNREVVVGYDTDHPNF